MNKEMIYGNLICETPRKDYLIGKIIGVIFTFVFVMLFILLVFLGVRDFIINGNISVKTLLTAIILGAIVVIILKYVLLPLAISQRFRIFEYGISPHRRPLSFLLKRLDYFIPFNEIEKIEIGKTTDKGKCVFIYPKKWKRILVEKSDAGTIVFDRLLEIAQEYKKLGNISP